MGISDSPRQLVNQLQRATACSTTGSRSICSSAAAAGCHGHAKMQDGKRGDSVVIRHALQGKCAGGGCIDWLLCWLAGAGRRYSITTST